MKWSSKNGPNTLKNTGFLAVTLLLGLTQSNAWAAGTASGTTISNSATLSFSVGGVTQPTIGSSPTGNQTGAGTPTTFVVDNKVNLTVIESNSNYTTVVPGQTKAVTQFTVTNNGNTVQDYSLVGVNTGGSVFTKADNFDGTSCSTVVESGTTAGYDATDTATYIDELAPDASKTVYVVCDIPSSQVNNDQANIKLTATTATGGTAGTQGADVAETTGPNTAGVDIVFADPATTANTSGTDPGQTEGDAKGVAIDAFRVISAVLSVSKAVTPICDPANGNSNPKEIPGGAVQYAITITNTGSADATLAQITDALDANLTFDPKLISGVSAPTDCVIGNAANSLSGTGFAAVKGTGATTTYAAPGVATQATTAGATAAGQNLTIDFPTLATSAITAPAGATVPAGGFITVYFNAFIK